MKKQLNTESVANELRGASAFFRRREEPKQQPEAQPAAPPPESELVSRPQEATRAPEPPPATERSSRTGSTPRTPVRPVRRVMKRHPFEIYWDQYEALQRLSIEDRMQGGSGSMSQMVREALDRLIAERRSGEGE